MDIVTIRVGGELNGGFISAAQAIGELLISHGYPVESVLIDREGRDPVRWKPVFIPGDLVTFVGDEDVLGTVVEVRHNGGEFRYGVKLDGDDGRSFYDAADLLPFA